MRQDDRPVPRGRPLIEVLFMDEKPGKPKKRGGSDTARERGLVGVVVHFTPDERAAVGRAAQVAALTVKEFCRRATLLLATHDVRP